MEKPRQTALGEAVQIEQQSRQSAKIGQCPPSVVRQALPNKQSLHGGSMARLKLLVCALALAASGCGSPGVASGAGAEAIAPTQPAQMRPDMIAGYVAALLKAGKADDARVWYVRGAIHSAVWNALQPHSYALEGYVRLVGSVAGVERLADLEPDTWGARQSRLRPT
jgi:hypothetical protein